MRLAARHLGKAILALITPAIDTRARSLNVQTISSSTGY
jgi:hypothetical protein